jgi:hypothetical protein
MQFAHADVDVAEVAMSSTANTLLRADPSHYDKRQQNGCNSVARRCFEFMHQSMRAVTPSKSFAGNASSEHSASRMREKVLSIRDLSASRNACCQNNE